MPSTWDVDLRVKHMKWSVSTWHRWKRKRNYGPRWAVHSLHATTDRTPELRAIVWHSGSQCQHWPVLVNQISPRSANRTWSGTWCLRSAVSVICPRWFCARNSRCSKSALSLSNASNLSNISLSSYSFVSSCCSRIWILLSLTHVPCSFV